MARSRPELPGESETVPRTTSHRCARGPPRARGSVAPMALAPRARRLCASGVDPLSDGRLRVRARAARARGRRARSAAPPSTRAPRQMSRLRRQELPARAHARVRPAVPAGVGHRERHVDARRQRRLRADGARAAAHARRPCPARLYLAYVLPYASYHEARANWRPLLYAKHRDAVRASRGRGRADARRTTRARARRAQRLPQLERQRVAGQRARRADAADGGRSSGPRAPRPPVVAPLDFVARRARRLSLAPRRTKPPAPALPRKVRLRLVLGVGDVRDVLAARAVGVPARQAGRRAGTRSSPGRLPRGSGRQRGRSLCCARRRRRASGGGSPNNHNWVEWWDSARAAWVHTNVRALRTRGRARACAPTSAPRRAAGARGRRRVRERGGRPGRGDARPRDLRDDVGRRGRTGRRVGPARATLLDAATLRLSDGADASPLVWANQLRNALGQPLKDTGLRLINRTDT